MLPSFTSLDAFSFDFISLSSCKTSAILFALASDKVIITNANESIIRDISILIIYEKRDVSSPVVNAPATILFAPNHDRAIIQAYIVSIIKGLFNTTSDSAFTNNSYKFVIALSNLDISLFSCTYDFTTLIPEIFSCTFAFNASYFSNT